MSDLRIPVTVVGGYLGAGKTSLVNHVLRHTDRPVAVLVNDFGDLDVDASMLESDDGTVLSFANGCVCCDLSDGLVAALDRLRSVSPAPERVLIESSGVGDLATVANYAALPGLRLDATVCVVDAESVRERSSDRWVGDLVAAQMQAADFVVCNKIDLVDEQGIADAHACIDRHAPDAVVVDAVRGSIDLDVLFEQGAERPPHQTSGDANSLPQPALDTFVSWVVQFPSPVSLDELREALDLLPQSVVRAKGFATVRDRHDESTVSVQVTGRRREIAKIGAPPTAMHAVSLIAIRDQFDPSSLPRMFTPA